MWNTFSDSLIKLDKASQEYITSFSGIDDNSKEFGILKKNGFIVFEQLDEFGRICLYEKQELFSRETDASYTIALGMGCNYCCEYCYEASANRSEVMTPEIASQVAEYICSQHSSTSHIQNISITWFGGEPLLYTDVLELISQKVIEYTTQNNIKYSARIITNGRFLDELTLITLQKYCVKSAQITIDGKRELYIKSKGASPEDFDSVISNVLSASGKIRLNIRLNIQNNDLCEAIAITDYLLSECDLIGKISLDFAFINDYSLSVNDARQAYIDYVDNYSRWVDYIVRQYGANKVGITVPRRKITFCGAVKVGNVCIGANGQLFRCFDNFGDNSMVVGDIWQGRFFNDTESLYYSRSYYAPENECTKCEWLPVCMGGCISQRIGGYGGFDCERYKHLQFKLKLLEGGVRI